MMATQVGSIQNWAENNGDEEYYPKPTVIQSNDGSPPHDVVDIDLVISTSLSYISTASASLSIATPIQVERIPQT